MGRGRRHRLRASRGRTPSRPRRSTRILAADFFTGSAAALPVGRKPRILRTHAVGAQRVRTRGGGRQPASDQSGALDEHLSAHRSRLAHAHPPRLRRSPKPRRRKRRPQSCIDAALPRTVVAARRPSADHLSVFPAEAAPAALSARTLGDSGRRFHRSRLAGCTATALRWWRCSTASKADQAATMRLR